VPLRWEFQFKKCHISFSSSLQASITSHSAEQASLLLFKKKSVANMLSLLLCRKKTLNVPTDSSASALPFSAN